MFCALFETLNGRIGETACFNVWAENFPGIWLPLGYDQTPVQKSVRYTGGEKSCSSAQQGNQDFSSNIGANNSQPSFSLFRECLSQFSSGFLPILIWISGNVEAVCNFPNFSASPKGLKKLLLTIEWHAAVIQLNEAKKISIYFPPSLL